MENMDDLKAAMRDLDEDTVIEILNETMADGGSEAQAAMDACQAGMNDVGKLFEDGEYFVGDLIFAGELMTEAVEILKSALVKGDGSEGKGRVLLCTVEGDLHDIGKNIVHSMLEAAGIEVIDLGIDVKPQLIVDTVKEQDLHVILLSGVLTLAVDSMKKIVDALKEAGVRDNIKILIGGAPVNEDTMVLTGADEWAFSPQKTVNKSLEWLQSYAS